jgi:drug/metabolite transporter (DMT)-like permease
MGPETAVSAVAPRSPPSGVADARNGVLLVFGAALVWSFGGAIARGLDVGDPWTIIAWRSFFAALFLIGFMLWRDGPAGTIRLFRTMGLPGIGVAVCFATASISFVVALGYTSVANILLMQAGVPLIAALLGVVFLREAVDRVTWGAILAVIAGIGVMVSDSFAANVSFIGDGLALVIAVVFAAATVITRRFSGVRMTPAVCLGVIIGTVVGATLSSELIVSARDYGLLFLFGAAGFRAHLGLAGACRGAGPQDASGRGHGVRGTGRPHSLAMARPPHGTAAAQLRNLDAAELAHPELLAFLLLVQQLAVSASKSWHRRHSTWRSRPCALPKWFRAR